MCTFKVYFLTVKAARLDTAAVRIITLEVHHSKYGQYDKGSSVWQGEISAITDLLVFVVVCSRRLAVFLIYCISLPDASWPYGEGVSPLYKQGFQCCFLISSTTCRKYSLSTVLTASSNSIVTVASIYLCCVLFNVLHQSYVYCFAVTFERTEICTLAPDWSISAHQNENGAH